MKGLVRAKLNLLADSEDLQNYIAEFENLYYETHGIAMSLFSRYEPNNQKSSASVLASICHRRKITKSAIISVWSLPINKGFVNRICNICSAAAYCLIHTSTPADWSQNGHSSQGLTCLIVSKLPPRLL